MKHKKGKFPSTLKTKFINKGEIGHGGNSTVYKVIKITDASKTEIALKYPGHLNSTKKSRFLTEIKIVLNEQMECKGILPIIESSCSPEGGFWYTMPIAKSIKNVLKGKSEEEMVSAVLQIAQTLNKLHEKNISHRDIKPENMFFYDNNFCLGDFGLVHYPESESLTKENKSLGPWTTMAPEMRREPKKYDGKKADVYSLAKTLWILLSKKDKSFDGVYDYNDSSIALKDKDFLRSIVDIHELLRDCTEHDPEKRPNMSEICDRLQEWLDAKDNLILNYAKEWEFIKKQLFVVPASTIRWTKLDDIIKVLNFVTKTKNLNHMLLPTGGGCDAIAVMKAHEKGHIFLYNEGTPIQLKPKALYMECIDTDSPMWNYFLLEADEVPCIEEGTVDIDKEYCAALPSGECIVSDGITYGKIAYDSDEDLPNDTVIAERYTKGKFLFVFKMAGYNSIGATYDGRHNDTNPEKFRAYIETMALATHFFAKDNGGARSFLNKYFSNNIFEKVKENKFKVKKLDGNPSVPIDEFISKEVMNWDFSSVIRDTPKILDNSPIKYYIEFRKPIIDVTSFRDRFGPHKYLCKNGKIKEGKKIQDIESEILYFDNREICISIQEKCDLYLKEILKSNDYSDIFLYYFHIEFFRNENIAPEHIFTRDEIKTSIQNADDRHFNTLVIEENGYAKIIQDESENPFLFPVRNSQWVAGNNYTGRHASLDDDYINDIYMSCLTGWLNYLETGKEQYTSEFCVDYNEETLLNKINKFYILF